ncbi:MAG: 3-dehydroquinate synthase [Clostridia bacterium]|nr:3-dehydroquinate synthase [Clostridia bacterium]
MNIFVNTQSGGYEIVLERGALLKAGELLNLNRKVLIVTDDGVPEAYAKAVASQCKEAKIVTIPQGEQSKNIENWSLLLKALIENNFTRTDCVVAVGGGVVGDLAGFVASSFMRGIDFYNIPTTLLSQVDSSIGGKTAIDFMGYKNLVGAFYPPKKVIIDPYTLRTLPQRQLTNGLCESIKMALTSDKELYEMIAKNDLNDDTLDDIIYRSLMVKKAVVEADEREGGLRKVLNFGHTIAHAIESINGLEKYYHGECVALGMLPMCSEKVRESLFLTLSKFGLPTELEEDPEQIIDAARHDKKAFGDNITVVKVAQIGEFSFENIPFSEFEEMIRSVTLK